ncbi:hypothetical protein AMTRI_Chr01g109390 [Amborella trichopoda]
MKLMKYITLFIWVLMGLFEILQPFAICWESGFWVNGVSNHVFKPLGPTISMRKIKRSECGRSRFIVLFLFSFWKEKMWKE